MALLILALLQRIFLMSSLMLLLVWLDRKSDSAGMPRPISYAVFCLKKKKLILILFFIMLRRPQTFTLFPYTTLFRSGQYFTNDQIKEMTRKVSAEVDLVHQQTQNQRYGSSHIGATAKDISNVVTDAASGVV